MPMSQPISGLARTADGANRESLGTSGGSASFIPPAPGTTTYWEGGVSDRSSSAQHIFGWFDIATVALRSDHESLDSADTYVEGSMELKRCVLAGVWPPTHQAWPVSHQPRRARGSRAVNRAETMLRW
jgi:hypothetical protein